MMVLNGKYNSCKVFTNNIEQAAISQIINIMNQESVKNSKIRIMSDVHAGADCVIGTTMTITDKVIPNLVSGDIGCGMLAIKLEQTEMDFAKLDEVIRKYVPSGYEIHEEAITELPMLDDIIAPFNKNKALKSLGTLGGGNHFIEVDKDSNGNLWLVIHTGSRYLGGAVFKYYQDEAYEALVEKASGSLKDMCNELIAKLKSEGREREISSELEKLKKIYRRVTPHVPKPFAYCEGNLLSDYLHDMQITQTYSTINRELIAGQIINHMNLRVCDSFETIHNYIDLDNMILRKGSVSANAGEKLIIPMNMRDGSLICIGKGNPDWNFSAPHGAGRVLSRSEAKELINIDEYRESMKGIYTTSVSQATIDESPFAYKPIEEIMANITDTVEIIDVIKPVYNFKASEEEKPWMKKK